MGKYMIITETGADVPAEIAKEYEITIVPMHVLFGTQTRDDGAFPTTDLFDYYKKTGKLPQTSGCTPADFTEQFDLLHEKYPDRHILYLAYSAVTTCSYQSAVIASQNRDYVSYYDTKSVSGAQTMVILGVAKFVRQHPDATLPAVEAVITDLVARIQMGFFPGDLVYLKAGGRVSNMAYLGAQILNLKPLIEIRDGVLISTKKYRGSMAAIAPKLLREFTENHRLEKNIVAFAYSAGLDEGIKRDITDLARSLGFQEVLWVETGCVVSTHSGPGAFGVVGFTQK